MKTSKKDYLITAVGFILALAGIILVKTLVNPDKTLLSLGYILIGLGCGAFGGGMGNVISAKSLKNSPEIRKRIEIDKNDERNIAVANKSKAKAYDIMTFVFGALLLSFALMRVETAAVLMLVFAYLFVEGCAVYYRVKYNKEM